MQQAAGKGYLFMDNTSQDLDHALTVLLSGKLHSALWGSAGVLLAQSDCCNELDLVAFAHCHDNPQGPECTSLPDLARFHGEFGAGLGIQLAFRVIQVPCCYHVPHLRFSYLTATHPTTAVLC